jgi:hypothetical protein
MDVSSCGEEGEPVADKRTGRGFVDFCVLRNASALHRVEPES